MCSCWCSCGRPGGWGAECVNGRPYARIQCWRWHATEVEAVPDVYMLTRPMPVATRTRQRGGGCGNARDQEAVGMRAGVLARACVGTTGERMRCEDTRLLCAKQTRTAAEHMHTLACTDSFSPPQPRQTRCPVAPRASWRRLPSVACMLWSVMCERVTYVLMWQQAVGHHEIEARIR